MNHCLALLLLSCWLMQAAAQSDPACASCPSGNCTYDKKLTCTCGDGNKTIVINNPREDTYTNVSLGFVVDDTGSMGTEIAQIKSGILNVISATAGIFDKYVIGTFNDPYVTNVVESADASVINSFVSGIAAHGGGDCPEFALSGIQEVANRTSPGSVIFLFTDASAKDLTLEPAVQALLLSKNIRLNVMITGPLCGSGLGGEFDRLANATNGTIYKTSVKSDVDYIMKYIINFAKYGITFLRGLPTTLEDLKAIASGSCTCSLAAENVTCVSVPVVKTCPEGYEAVEVRIPVCVRPRPCKWIVRIDCRKIELPCPCGYKRVNVQQRVCESSTNCRKRRSLIEVIRPRGLNCWIQEISTCICQCA